MDKAVQTFILNEEPFRRQPQDAKIQQGFGDHAKPNRIKGLQLSWRESPAGNTSKAVLNVSLYGFVSGNKDNRARAASQTASHRPGRILLDEQSLSAT